MDSNVHGQREVISMERLKYEVEDETIAELLGVQNFTNEMSAMLELVKNAYDAQAKYLTLDFSNGHLVIEDDGIGMNADDIRKHWMHVGKSDKGYFSLIDKDGKQRVLAGSKGVGRFALARLGRKVKMITQKMGSCPVEWNTDWGESTLEEYLGDNALSCGHGTKIDISLLRDRWTDKRISSLTNYLSITYNDDQMKIQILPQQKLPVQYIFHNPELGRTHVSTIHLNYDGQNLLTYDIKNDEFLEDAQKYCGNLDIHEDINSVNIFNELSTNDDFDLSKDELGDDLKKIGNFSAEFYFSLKSSTMTDKENFLYKYETLQDRYDYGIVLYRNAFSIASFDGSQDWLELNRRVRSSPAAATHPTGSWRVRANQISGYVMIDKAHNPQLKDMANRQGLEENIYYKLLVKIVTIGISCFERYRQKIIRSINKKNEKIVRNQTPVLDKVLKTPESVQGLSASQIRGLHNELNTIRKETKHIEQQKKEIEGRYHYDVRVLNVFVTIGLKAAAIAHEAGNDLNTIDKNYERIVNALKTYGFWEELNSPEKTQHVYKNVPELLLRCKDVNHKTSIFIKTMLEQIEKHRFQNRRLNVNKEINRIAQKWMRDYAKIKIKVLISSTIEVDGSSDIFDTIFDNLILNSWQQNSTSNQNLNVKICASRVNGFLEMSYIDDGAGLSQKYINNPRRILEVHETSRKDGHGLGMWIVNNTIQMTGGEVVDIDGHGGFSIRFCLGDRL